MSACWLRCPRPGCDGDIRVEVAGEPGTPAVHYPNDRAYPGDPAVAWIGEVLEATCGHELTDDEVDRMGEDQQETLLDHLDDVMEAAEDAYYDRQLHAAYDEGRR